MNYFILRKLGSACTLPRLAFHASKAFSTQPLTALPKCIAETIDLSNAEEPTSCFEIPLLSEEQSAALAPPDPFGECCQGPITEKGLQALQLLKSQESSRLFAVLLLGDLTTLKTVVEGDLLFSSRLADANIGDIVRLSQVKEIGSKNYTLRAPKGKFLNPAMHYVTGIVVDQGISKEVYAKMGFKKKGHIKQHKTQLPFTAIRITHIQVNV